MDKYFEMMLHVHDEIVAVLRGAEYQFFDAAPVLCDILHEMARKEGLNFPQFVRVLAEAAEYIDDPAFWVSEENKPEVFGEK